jgi:hypothetical protein
LRSSIAMIAVVSLTVVGCAATQGAWQTGIVAGAHFRLHVPTSWNRSLIMAAGGYSPSPLTFEAGQSPGPFADALVRQGYAYAETGYSAGGVAIAEGIADVHALRAHFVERYGVPQRTLIIGESKGGLIALLIAESPAAGFDGAMAISGLLSSPNAFFSRAFGLLSTFQDRFPGVLPSPLRVPDTYEANEQTMTTVINNLAASAESAGILRSQAGVRSNEELAELLAFHTEALRDLQRRCGGNAFGAAPGVDPSAERCVRNLPAPTGSLQVPFVAVDTAYDPVIPSWSADGYLTLLERTGSRNSFVREVVHTEGHLNVSVEDRLRAFRTLVEWVTEGRRQ